MARILIVTYKLFFDVPLKYHTGQRSVATESSDTKRLANAQRKVAESFNLAKLFCVACENVRRSFEVRVAKIDITTPENDTTPSY